jgi:N-acetylglucosaminyldiphosphoundecaprenol N-acetyl-beta-D-mannosaminyltransferase
MRLTAPSSPGRVTVAGLEVDGLTEQQVVARVIDSLDRGQGGWIFTLNVDICRAVKRDPALAALTSGASISVPDGMPLVWAARLCGEPLAERVTGSSLIFSLSEAASLRSKSVYMLGGASGVPEKAGDAMATRYPGLAVAGCDSPPVGFDTTAEGIDAVRRKVTAAEPDIVFVGMGFPKQEKLIRALLPSLPKTWFVACGAAIPMAAGTLRRAPQWVQRAGLEWLFRLLSEPQRLFTRYVVHDLPFATSLLVGALGRRAKMRRRAPLRPGD